MNAATLGPAEALVLLDPNARKGRDAVKLTLTWLLARGVVRIEEEVQKRLIGSKTVTRLRLVRPNEALPSPAAALVGLIREVEAKGGPMDDLVERTRRAYGSDLDKFRTELVLPELGARGLVEEKREKRFGFFPVKRFARTPAGEVERSRIESLMEQARGIPGLLDSDPAKAAALALSLGGALLLVNELKPFYGKLSEAMRAQPGLADYDHSSSSDWSGTGDAPDLPSFEGLDLGDFDASAFDSLDTALDSFDSSFESSSDGGGGDTGGGGSD